MREEVSRTSKAAARARGASAPAGSREVTASRRRAKGKATGAWGGPSGGVRVCARSCDRERALPLGLGSWVKRAHLAGGNAVHDGIQAAATHSTRRQRLARAVAVQALVGLSACQLSSELAGFAGARRVARRGRRRRHQERVRHRSLGGFDGWSRRERGSRGLLPARGMCQRSARRQRRCRHPRRHGRHLRVSFLLHHDGHGARLGRSHDFGRALLLRGVVGPSHRRRRPSRRRRRQRVVVSAHMSRRRRLARSGGSGRAGGRKREASRKRTSMQYADAHAPPDHALVSQRSRWRTCQPTLPANSRKREPQKRSRSRSILQNFLPLLSYNVTWQR
jgi:hypothetical protein